MPVNVSELDLFNGVQRAVDLCAAPGSWSQVLSHALAERNQVQPDAIRIGFEFCYFIVSILNYFVICYCFILRF